MLFSVLAFAAVVLTYAMFQSRNAMLGFPCAIFWGVLGGYAYTQSAATWDIYYFLFISALLGMTPFCMYAAFALRTKKQEQAEGDTFIDEGKDDTRFVDEGKDKTDEVIPSSDGGTGDSPAERRERRLGGSRKKKIDYGEFK